MKFKAAFFKGQHGFLGGAVIRWWENGPYSHCELVFSDGVWGSSVGEEGGVVLRPRAVIEAEWDYIELPPALEPSARLWFEAHKGKSYDYVGLLRFVFDFLGASKDKWVCSRAVSDALGLKDGWREGPNGLYALLENAMIV
jgi:hypothetical protein